METDFDKLYTDFLTTDKEYRPNYNNIDGFIPCPFCGDVPHIRVEDDEGNCRDYDKNYEKNPYSGLWYVIEHTRDYNTIRGKALKNT
jgi:hypothetical protein